MAGKKERRSQRDRAKARRQKEGPVKKQPKTLAQKAVEKALHKQRKEQGQAGLAGAGRAGKQPTKKQKDQRPYRKRKHKGQPHTASIQRVADAYLSKQADLEIDAAPKVRIPVTVYWKPAGKPDYRKYHMTEEELKDSPNLANLGTIKGILGIDVAGQKHWLSMTLPIAGNGKVVTIGEIFKPLDVQFIRGSDKPFRKEPQLARMAEYLLAGHGSLDETMRHRSFGTVQGRPGNLKVILGKGKWHVRGEQVQPQASPFAQSIVRSLTDAYAEQTGEAPFGVPALVPSPA